MPRAPTDTGLALQVHAEGEVSPRIRGIAQVVHAVDFDHIDVFCVEPVARPCVNKSERVAAVLEAAVTAVIVPVDVKRMFPAKTGPETVIGNAAAVIARRALRLLRILLFLLIVLVLLLRAFLFLPGVLVLLLRVFLLLLLVSVFLLSVFLFLLGVLVLLRGLFFWLRSLFLCRFLVVRFVLFFLL